MFDVPTKQREIEELETRMSQPGFWDSQQTAQKVMAEANRLKRMVEGLTVPVILVDGQLSILLENSAASTSANQSSGSMGGTTANSPSTGSAISTAAPATIAPR